jgi:AhpD family alkylhydroperoxidase
MENVNPKPRIEMADANPRIYPLMKAFGDYLETSSVGAAIRDLIKIRASQINGCAFCLDMHLQEARHRGETQDRLDLVSVWREAPCFSEEERAALELAEAVTLVAQQGIPGRIVERALQHFTKEQYVDLLATINVINAWNRFMIGMGHAPPPRTGRAHAEVTK